jgi:hypothetical protein
MSNNVVPFETAVPAHLADRVGQPSALSDSLSGGIGGGIEFPRISIKGARFRIVDDGVETVLNDTSLEVIIVGANPGLSKSWYATAWNPDAEPNSPDCFTNNGIVPDPESKQPQNDICASCQQNAWGSRITQQGTEVKACSDQKRLAVIAATDPTGPVYLLQVTPAALKGLNKYDKELKMRNIPPDIIKTVISFDTDASFPKLSFGFGGYIDAAVLPVIEELFGSDQVNEIIGFDPSAPVPAPVTALPAPAAAPVAEAPAPAAEPAPAGASFGQPAAAEAPATPAPEPVTEAPAATAPAGASFGQPAAPATPEPAAAPAPEPVAVEPEAAPVAAAEPATVALAAEITQLMDDVADDADAPEGGADG